MQKINEAEHFVVSRTEDEDNDEYISRFNQGLSIYKKMSMNNVFKPEEKLQVLISFIKHIPEEGNDMLCRFRDMIPFVKGEEQLQLVKLLKLICNSSQFNSHERLVTAVTLYNRAFIQECYECFINLVYDPSLLVNYKVDATRYLIASFDDTNRQIAQEALIEIIDSNELISEFRYNVIAGFISKTGISTMLNVTKLPVGYDEDFVYGLQTSFFYNEKNGIRERILSGQHMLQMNLVEQDEKDEIADMLLAIAENESFEYNARADAADVVYRLCTGDRCTRAREIISITLGFHAINSSSVGSKSSNFIDKAKTIYSNQQNVHEVEDCVNRFIEKMMEETSVKPRPYHELHTVVADIIRNTVSESEKKFAAYKALNRVSIDTATFTKYNVTISEVFVHVWTRIELTKDDETRNMLTNRFIEELCEMSDTCSSGHSARFINVLSTVDDSLNIGWDDQISANIAGRLNARIRDCEDLDLKSQIALGMMEDADPEDILSYKSFVNKELELIKVELHNEFVGEGYISDKEFNNAFEKGISQF